MLDTRMLRLPTTRLPLLMIALYFLGVTPEARAQVTGEIGDVPVVAIGQGAINANEVGFCASSAGCQWGVAGSINQSATADGYTFQAFVDLPGTAKQGGTYFRTGLSLSGFSADPGQNWLVSAVVNGLTFTGAAAKTYTYANGQAWWYWQTGPAFQGKSGAVTCTILHVGQSGWVRPKYLVVGMTYAPPGSKSTATYTNGFVNGTSETNTATFITTVTNKEVDTMGINLFQVVSGTVTDTTTSVWSQEQDDTNSITVAQTEATGLIVPGPASSGAGVDHDYDAIYIWLNPEVFMEEFNSVIVTNGFGWDGRDTITGMDVLPLTVGQLKGTQPITDPAVITRLARTWDTSLGAVTAADYQDILRADPFVANPSFNPNTDTSGRYELPEAGTPATPTDLIFNYVPVPAGGQATGQTYTSSYTATSVAGQTAKDTHSVTYSFDTKASVTFILAVSTDSSEDDMYSYSNQTSHTITSGTSQSANFTIFPPLSTDDYTGPTAIQVWKDNVYGTFMFYPEN